MVLGLLTYDALIDLIIFVTNVLDKCDKYSIVSNDFKRDI